VKRYNRDLQPIKFFPTLLALFVLGSGIALPKTQPKTNKSSKSATGKPAAKSTGHRGTKKNASKNASRPRHSAQMAPTPERYREIQQALAAKGYFNGESDGRWSADSTEALRRFQHDQNLTETGKLDSVSLIALGLGPKRTAGVQTGSQPSQTRP
jgi:peptidoglycan hydrolase-like protein with peptidoglycan-binding domain